MAGIIVKSNPTSGSTPDPQYLAVGELAFNSYDGRLFSKKQNGDLVLINYKPNPSPLNADTAISSSYALTASYALNAAGGAGSSVSSSWASSSISSSYSATASVLLGSIESASYALTSSYAANFGESGQTSTIFYVSPDGSDSNSGKTLDKAFRTIKQATLAASASRAANPGFPPYRVSIHVKTGYYEEVAPVTVPAYTSILGDDLRSVIVKPTTGTKTENLF